MVRDANPSIRIQGAKLRVPAGSASHPISRIRYKLFAPLRWYQGTIAHIVVLEICSLGPRIRECIRDKQCPVGFVPLQSDPRPDYRPALANSTSLQPRHATATHCVRIRFPSGTSSVCQRVLSGSIMDAPQLQRTESWMSGIIIGAVYQTAACI